MSTKGTRNRQGDHNPRRTTALSETDRILVFKGDLHGLQRRLETALAGPDGALSFTLDAPDPDRKGLICLADRPKHERIESGGSDQACIVVQCMFVVVDRRYNQYLLTVHDRSYSGAEDARSKYALITGRLRVADLQGQRTMDVHTVFMNALKRELQEIDEMNLGRDEAGKYVDRAQYAGVFTPEAPGRRSETIVSGLFTIQIEPQEYNRLNERGPYLIPLNCQELSKLRSLGLLGDILTSNSCSECLDERLRQQCHDCPQQLCCRAMPTPTACIPKSIYRTVRKPESGDPRPLDPEAYPDTPLARGRVQTGRNSIIVFVDISNYALLDSHTMLEVRDQLQRLLYGYFPIPSTSSYFPNTHAGDAGRYALHIQTTGDGYLVVLKRGDAPAYLATLAYFFALYLKIKVGEMKKWGRSLTPKPYDVLDIRVSVHADDLQECSSLGETHYPGSGVVAGQRLIDFGRPGHILGSLDFAVQLIAELEELHSSKLSQDVRIRTKGIRTRSKGNTIAILPGAADGGSTLGWSKDMQQSLLRALELPPDVIATIEGAAISSSLAASGIVLEDCGYLTDKHGIRHKAFNLSVFPKHPKYASREQPVKSVPVILRDPGSTEVALDQLARSLGKARHLTIYGYSNIRMLREVRSDLDKVGDPPEYFDSLEELRLVFRPFDHVCQVNEQKPRSLARVDWLMGFLEALRIAQVMHERDPRNGSSNVRVIINHAGYAFNVLKVIYSSKAGRDHSDHIRLAVPVPGHAFEMSPLFVLVRGDPLFPEYLEICEEYIEKGHMHESDAPSTVEYGPRSRSARRMLQDFFDETVMTNRYKAALSDLRQGQPADAAHRLVAKTAPWSQDAEDVLSDPDRLGRMKADALYACQMMYCLEQLAQFHADVAGESVGRQDARPAPSHLLRLESSQRFQDFLGSFTAKE